ncbi:MAG: transposase [Alphaproteobacteria bacterium]|nr:transposase [Alphaproteobacteria bacterium]MCB9744966.1 transposase [Alphaproteobacteria bacterium]MCB9792418.1 transposase [Alphaproteobacteria bacterium]MCB9794554.1 transposase [Alphaproteobacteria bacterium]
MALLLLRHSEAGLSRVGAVRRANSDATWRAALRLPWEKSPPDEKTLREFEAFLQAAHPQVGRPRIELAFEHWTRLCLEEGVLGDVPSVFVADSTPMWCFGAVRGTVRLLGDGLRSLGRLWARTRGVDLRTVALEWRAPLLLAKSTKGHFADTDWSSASDRSEVLAVLAETVNEAVEQVLAGLEEVRANKRQRLARRCRNLLRVVEEDLEGAESGGLRVKRRQSAQRLISVTDPDAQQFRKSASKVCSGFKIHAFGDAVSGLILALAVRPGGEHDSTQLLPLLMQAKRLHTDINEVLADTAYGGMETRITVQQVTGVRVLAPPIRNSSKGDGLGKEDFAIDFEEMVATCPGGVETATWRYHSRDGRRTWGFHWERGSEERCACRERCLVHKSKPAIGAGRPRAPHRILLLHPDEQALRRVRAAWQKPETRMRYKRRAQGERLMRELTRRGARHAASWGLENASLQAFAAASISNLLILAKRLAAKDTQAPRRAA